MSGGGFARRGPASSLSSTFAAGRSSVDAPDDTPQQRDEDQARAELISAQQLVAEAKKLERVPAAAWDAKRAALEDRLAALVAALRSPVVAPTENADRDRTATVAAIAEARTVLAEARRPRAVLPVAGEVEIEPRIADRSIAPEEVIDWMAGLSASERAAVWRRFGRAHDNRDDSFAVALANYAARHRDRTPPLSADLHALATMDARRFAEWRGLSGRGSQLGGSELPARAEGSRPLEPGGRSFVDAARDLDHDGRTDVFGGTREVAPPSSEQTQADVAATRAGVEQALAALGLVTGQILPAYDDAVGALDAAGANRLQERAIFVFRQAVELRTRLRAMGGTDELSRLEAAIDRAGAELTRRITGRELHGRPVWPGVATLDLSHGGDPAAQLQHDAEIAVGIIDTAQQIAARLSPESSEMASAATIADPAAAQEAAALVHSWRSRPLSFAFLRALLVERGLWSAIESAQLRFGNRLPMLRTLADDTRAAEAQAGELGAEVDVGAFDLGRAEDLLRANRDAPWPGAHDRTRRAREVLAMIGSAEPAASGRILEALERRGLLEELLDALAPGEVAALHERMPVRGLGAIKAETRRRFEGRDTADRSVSHYLGKVPALGGLLKFAGNVATGGFLGEHDSSYAAMKRGDITEAEHDATTDHAAVRSLATVAASGYVGGAGGAYAEGLTAGIAARSTVGRIASRTFVGAAEGFTGGLGGQAGADLVDRDFSGFGAYGYAGGVGAGIGAGISVTAGVGAEGARFLPPGVQTVAQKLYGLFPHHADIFDGIRAAGAEHAVAIRIKVGRLLQVADDLHLAGARPALALAAADGGPHLGVDDEVLVTVRATRPLDVPGVVDGPAPISILKAERLPEHSVSRPGDGLDGGPVSTPDDGGVGGPARAADDAAAVSTLDDDFASRTADTTSPATAADDELASAARAAAARARIVQAIGDIPISSMPATSGRPSYFISRADGAELQRLLALLPDVRVTEFPRGLTIHRDGSDWFLEWLPEQGAPAHALAGDRAADPAGLPPENASLVMFYGFRGLKNVDGVYWKNLPPDKLAKVRRIFDEEPLMHMGHVGVSFDGGRTIHGFTPSGAGLSAEELMAKVVNHEPLPGVVLDDTKVFARARELAAQGWDLEISTAALAMDGASRAAAFGENERLMALSRARAPTGKDYQLPYERPNEQGAHYPNDHTRNCATYPQMLGLCVPETSGQLREYIAKLKEWAVYSPVELRGKVRP